MSCPEGDEGSVHEGLLTFDSEDVTLDKVPKTRTRVMMNIASPAAAFRWWRLPCEGIGLARIEFIINNCIIITIHPLALVRVEAIEGKSTCKHLESVTHGYPDKATYFVEPLARGTAKIAAS